MDAHFTRSFYKHIIGMPISFEDVEAVEPDYYRNLKWMLENDIEDLFDLTFTAERDFFGRTEIVELKPGGAQIKVTKDNVYEYVSLVSRSPTRGSRSRIAGRDSEGVCRVWRVMRAR